MKVTAAQQQIIDVIARLESSALYTEASLWQYAGYEAQLAFVLAPDGEVVLVSVLRPADACGHRLSGCYCWLPASHDATTHLCGCGGSWREHPLKIVTWPGPFARLEVRDEDQPRPERTEAEQARLDMQWREARARAARARAKERGRRSAASHRPPLQSRAAVMCSVNEWCGKCGSWQPRPHQHPATPRSDS